MSTSLNTGRDRRAVYRFAVWPADDELRRRVREERDAAVGELDSVGDLLHPDEVRNEARGLMPLRVFLEEEKEEAHQHHHRVWTSVVPSRFVVKNRRGKSSEGMGRVLSVSGREPRKRQ